VIGRVISMTFYTAWRNKTLRDKLLTVARLGVPVLALVLAIAVLTSAVVPWAYQTSTFGGSTSTIYAGLFYCRVCPGTNPGAFTSPSCVVSGGNCSTAEGSSTLAAGVCLLLAFVGALCLLIAAIFCLPYASTEQCAYDVKIAACIPLPFAAWGVLWAFLGSVVGGTAYQNRIKDSGHPSPGLALAVLSLFLSIGATALLLVVGSCRSTKVNAAHAVQPIFYPPLDITVRNIVDT